MLRVALTVALAVMGLAAFCLIIAILLSIMWAAPIG